MVNELNREIELQRSQLQEQQTKLGQGMSEIENSQRSSPNKPGKAPTTNGVHLREQLTAKEEQRQALIRALADIRSDMVKIADGNLKAMNEEDRQSLSVQALITNRTAQLQEKIDDYEKQIQNLKRELKTQKTQAQQYIDEATDAREKLGKLSLRRSSVVRDSLSVCFAAQNDKKLSKLQQQNATLTDNAQRRMTGQQLQQGQVGIDEMPSPSNEFFQGDDTVESLRRQVRLLEDKLRKTRTAERPFDEPKVRITGLSS